MISSHAPNRRGKKSVWTVDQKDRGGDADYSLRDLTLSLSLREDDIQRKIQSLVGLHRGRLRHGIRPADHRERGLVIGRIPGAFDDAHRHHMAETIKLETH